MRSVKLVAQALQTTAARAARVRSRLNFIAVSWKGWLGGWGEGGFVGARVQHRGVVAATGQTDVTRAGVLPPQAFAHPGRNQRVVVAVEHRDRRVGERQGRAELGTHPAQKERPAV